MTLNNLDCILVASNEWMVVKGGGRKWYYHGIYLEGLKKTTKDLSVIIAEI
jgi:hypothetical protein